MALTDLVGSALDVAADLAGAFSGAIASIQPVDRSIGSIFPDVVVEEGHRDESLITAQPVEGGATITDHVFDRPPSVEIKGGFSNSSAGYEGYVQQQYQALLKLKASKKPFNISTGKRRYKSMLIQAIAVQTDGHSEFVLNFVAICQNINIVKTATQQGAAQSNPANGTKASDASSQSNPSSSASVETYGNKEATGVQPYAFGAGYDPSSGLGTVQPGKIGDASLGEVGSALSGLSPPPITGDIGSGVAVADDGTKIEIPGYNPFAVGAFGGT